MRHRTLAALLSVTLLGTAASCEALFGGFGVDNRDNCARNGELCTASEACNEVTRVCEPAIELTAITPSIGTNRGGETVVLTGRLLSPELTVLFDGVPVTIGAGSPTGAGDQLTVTTPPIPGKKGPVAIKLVHPLGQVQERQGLFSYYSPIQFQPTAVDGPRDPRCILITDWNGDGKPDLLVGDNTRNELQLFPGNGDGTVGTMQATTLELSPSNCVMADVTGDGKLDVAVIDQFGYKQQMVLGNGAGVFQALPSTSTVGAQSDMALLDVNGDGKADLITGEPPGATVQISDGAGGFSSLTRYPVHNAATQPVFIAVADVDGDGKADILTGNGIDSLYGLILGNGQGGFATPLLLPQPKAPKRVLAVDVNQDGKLDLLGTGSADLTIYLSLAKADGTYDSPAYFKVLGNVGQLLVADLNGDGLLDMAWFTVVTKNNFGTYIGLGNGNFVDAQAYTEGLAPSTQGLGDLNGDGKPDIVIGERAISAQPALGKLRILINKSE